MKLWAIVPVKPLRRGKSRLSSILSEDERTLLNYGMLENTLRALNGVEEIDRILVVSRDPSALALAREHKAKTVQEDGAPELNSSLRRATEIARIYEVQSVLILPADLPLIQSQDISELIAQAGKPPEIIIAPDRREDGTNGLIINPAGLIDYRYGPGSFKHHVAQAGKTNIRLVIWRTPTFSLDLDLPEDLALLKQISAAQINTQIDG